MGLKMVNYEPMIRINIADVKTNLSRYLERVERGETIILCRRNVPIAEIRPLPKQPGKPRPVGIDRGMTIPASFFEPLPDDILDAFEGRGESK
jgi:antitoxin (DNA-binding transcriptional repressor) of toxin-antitoxin stability system